VFYVELMKAKPRDSARRFLDDLERLPELSKEELEGYGEDRFCVTLLSKMLQNKLIVPHMFTNCFSQLI